jgi:hypothetical protein
MPGLLPEAPLFPSRGSIPVLRRGSLFPPNLPRPLCVVVDLGGIPSVIDTNVVAYKGRQCSSPRNARFAAVNFL